jgi:hypothetical protein
MYNSNLELQYLVHSRCRHFISNYSTIFTLDNSINVDKSLETKFKSHGIELGSNVSFSTKTSNNIKIITNVKFSSQEDYYNNLGGYSVSLDKIGFKYLIESFNKDNDNAIEKFKNNGIYKIMTFIDLYIEKVIKHEKNSRYTFIKDVMTKIKKYLSLTEYANILCNYFNISSQWIHFRHFIDLLSNKTQSYDKLGYLIIINDNEINENEKLHLIIKFIQERCIVMKIEDQFWEMLKPHRKDLKYFIKDKLYNDYDFITRFNWYGIDSLINNIMKYNLNFDNLTDDDIFRNLVKNMKLGYRQVEFYENLIPFVIRHCHSLNYIQGNDLFLSNILESSLSFESFIVAKITSLSNLNQYLKSKIERIKTIFNIIEEFDNSVNNQAVTNKIQYFHLFKEFIKDTFNKKYKYFNKKLNIILGQNNEKGLLELMNIDDTQLIGRHSIDFSNIASNVSQRSGFEENENEEIKIKLLDFLKKLLYYNEKININSLPINNFGFDKVKKNYDNGIKEIEFNRTIKPFISKLIKLIISNNFKPESNEFKILMNLNIIEKFTFNNFKDGLDNFYEIVQSIKIFIERYTENINIDNDVITNLCFY